MPSREEFHSQGIARKMIELKALLPTVNVSRLVTSCLTLLLEADMQALSSNFERLRSAQTLTMPCACLS
jgi:hypothetical protein